jgi:hypothetical protein
MCKNITQTYTGYLKCTLSRQSMEKKLPPIAKVDVRCEDLFVT